MALGVLRRTLAAAIALATLLALPTTAEAVLAGKNGRIVFVSGRDGADGDDSQSKIYLRTVTSSAGGGAAGEALTSAAGQHRHPTWSPDRKKIAYARTVKDGQIVFIHNLLTGGITPISAPLTVSDRPAWSPDGTRIAYESGPSATSTDILVYTIATERTRNLTAGTTPFDSRPASKPAWTPNSKTIYYASGNASVGDADIVREPARGGKVTPILSAAGVSEFQPSISPDGKSICFTRGDGFNGTADVYVAPLANTAAQFDLSDNRGTGSQHGDYNCTWSPDGEKIAYVRGIFTSGALVMENADDSSQPPIPVLEDDANNFDGNPDWAPDARPRCEKVVAEILRGSSVVLPLRCSDRGPGYERTPVSESIVDFPADGSLGPVQQGNPSRVRYQASDDFLGVDTFTFRGVDAFGPGPVSRATVKVFLPGRCGNFERGNRKRNVLVGTKFGDLLRGLGGNDKLRALAGDDCLEGGGGDDRLEGGAGDDLLIGGAGANTYFGGGGDDDLRARNGQAERVACGKGKRDRARVDFVDAVEGCERVSRG